MGALQSDTTMECTPHIMLDRTKDVFDSSPRFGDRLIDLESHLLRRHLFQTPSATLIS